MNPLISVITPCFNHGKYLEDACRSVSDASNKEIFEHIIINDGSTDSFTIKKLQELESKGFHIIHQANAGLANARNSGLEVAKGKYILPLDSDNKIVADVMLEALEILERNDGIDMVYTDAYLFGERETIAITGDFDLFKELYNNYIDACSLIKKDTIVKLGGYDPHMPFMGHEDWELWVNIALHGGKFQYLPAVGYHYRVVKNSMLQTITRNKQAENRNYIFTKHSEFMADIFVKLYEKESDLLQMDRYIKINKMKTILKLLFNRSLIK